MHSHMTQKKLLFMNKIIITCFQHRIAVREQYITLFFIFAKKVRKNVLVSSPPQTKNEQILRIRLI
jgi:hypothetical protein